MAEIETVKDPVCGMQFEPHTAAMTHEYEGDKYYFCSNDCFDNFLENPSDYHKKEEAA
ncbi:MAG: YHS domain-containing protein [Dehalococcoidia bacterium]|nr:YHS domain-containing protein [Dehalococcoidia bacterium]